jgi:hypothetical protein
LQKSSSRVESLPPSKVQVGKDLEMWSAAACRRFSFLHGFAMIERRSDLPLSFRARSHTTPRKGVSKGPGLCVKSVHPAAPLLQILHRPRTPPLEVFPTARALQLQAFLFADK